ERAEYHRRPPAMHRGAPAQQRLSESRSTMESRPIAFDEAGITPGRARRQARIKGVPVPYIRVCKGPGRRLLSTLTPEPGEWILRADGELELAGDPPRALEEGEVLVPSLARL